MSKIQVNEIVNHFDTDAPDFPRGLTVSHTGVSTFTGDVDCVGIITAQSGIVIGTGASVGNPTNNELGLYTNSTERLRVTGIGSIGIGTDYPRSKFDIQGAITFRNGNQLNAIETTDDGKLQFYRNDIGNNEKTITINDSNGNVGIGSTIPGAQLEVNQSNGNTAFRAKNTKAEKGGNKYQLIMRDDTFDNNRHSQVYFNEDGYPVWGHNIVGTSMNYASVYAGRTQSDNDSPTNYYRNGSHSFSAYSGRTDAQNNYRTQAFMRAWDGGDDGDRNVIYYVNSGSDTTTADYDQHQKFGIKADGRAQFGASSYIGRVESDEATPNSVYLGVSGTALLIYPNSASYYNFVRARTTDNTDDVFKVDSGGGVVIKFQSDGNGRFDGGADIGAAADYAEYFEWTDGNISSADRRGITVVLDGEKIRPATDSDDTSKIIGVVSANPAVVGDSAWSEWQLAHLKDAYGSFVTKDEEFLVWNKFGTYIDENGNKVPNPQPNVNDYNMASEHQILVSDIEAEKAKGNVPQAAIDQNLRVTKPSRVYNPDYDPSRNYVPRSERKEWDAIGLLGKLVVRRGQPIGSNWILMKSNVGVDPNDSSIVLDRYLVR